MINFFSSNDNKATSNCDYKTILTCKDLNITFDDYFVAKDLNLKPLVQNPPQAKKYKNFMENC